MYSLGNAQSPTRLMKNVEKFKIEDSINCLPENAILFVGSSSFTSWKDVREYFPSKEIINRGFGGSTLNDLIYYADDVIFPYNAKQIVIYSGENDFAFDDNITTKEVFLRFCELYGIIRNKYEKVDILYVSMKPSPRRNHLIGKMAITNMMIKQFLSQRQHAAYVDVYSKMLTDGGEIMNDIFLNDNLHMNAKGYAIWQTAIDPFLLE
jgi:lysophospholipase L1-like esterase